MTEEILEDAYLFLRANTRGDLRFEEHFESIKYVIAPSGRLVAPVMVAMLQAVDTVLFIPDVREDATEVLLTLEEFDETRPDGSMADRWRIHHGTPPDVNWAFMDIDTVRHRGLVIDGDALIRPNPLAADEPRLCKQMNEAHIDDLRQLCLRYAHVEVDDPRLVAVDPLGIDVRGRFDVIRVAAIEPMNGADEVLPVLTKMLSASG